MADVATQLIRTQLLERRRRLESVPPGRHTSSYAELLREIDMALERMAAGVYGLCEECHDPIEPDRLISDPLVRFCVDHMTEEQRRFLEQDLSMAGRIQTTLLPGRGVKGEGWDTAYCYEPAGPVSGDYCDLLAAEGQLLFFTGDVSGKGIAASLLVSHLHAMFHSLPPALPLTGMMEHANRVLCESTLPSHYATLVAGRTCAGGEVELSNAGHCPPLVLGRGVVRAVPESDLPLGLFAAGRYQTVSLLLEPGQGLLLYSDGLTEARNAAGEDYGFDRLCSVLGRSGGNTARDWIDTALADWRAFTAGEPQADDLTLMAVQRL